jgi:hypothetical protein
MVNVETEIDDEEMEKIIAFIGLFTLKFRGFELQFILAKMIAVRGDKMDNI